MNGVNKCIVAILVCLIDLTKGNAQSEKRPIFLGINPSVTVEPFYQKGEFDVNIFPFVFQRPITNRFDLRLTTILNLGIRDGDNEISHFGLETALPFYVQKKSIETAFPNGVYLAPIVSLTRNRMEQHTNFGLWMEPGYSLLFENMFAMTFGLQLGATYFGYDNGEAKWGNHFGVKVIVGRWIRPSS